MKEYLYRKKEWPEVGKVALKKPEGLFIWDCFTNLI